MLDKSGFGDGDDPKLPRQGLARITTVIAPRLMRAASGLKRRAAGMALAGAFLLAIAATGLISALTSLVLLLMAAAVVAWMSSNGYFETPDEHAWGTQAAAAPAPGSLIAVDRQAADGWRLVIDALPEPAVALDRLGAVQHANHPMRELYPKVRDGVPFSHVSRNPELMAAIDNASTVGQPIMVQLVERVPVDRRIEVTVARLTTARAETSMPVLLVTFRDLSEQDRLDQMRADFVANASHELRTPLASLRGFVETLQGPARDDAAARERFLGLMASQSVRMSRLIDDLLSLSRVEMRAHLPPRGVVDLNEVAAYVRQTLEPLALADRVEVKLHKLDGPARIRGDREEIVQVVQNLSQNAIKYGRPGGHVDIRIDRAQPAGKKPATLTLAVVDDGPGIAPEHLPRLTERFYRVSATSSREKGGTGLGLAIVKHIVMRHRGELRISSELGSGSRFAAEFDELGDAMHI